MTLEAILARFSPRAQRYLSERSARIDPALAGDTIPAGASEAVAQIARELGGLAWTEIDGRQAWIAPVRAIELARAKKLPAMKPEVDHGGESCPIVGVFVPLAYHVSSTGIVLEVSDGEYAFPAADSLITRIEQYAFDAIDLLELIEDREAESITVIGQRGEAAAAALDATLVPEASDALRRWWLGADAIVHECFEESAWKTFVHVTSERLQDAQRAVA